VSLGALNVSKPKFLWAKSEFFMVGEAILLLRASPRPSCLRPSALKIDPPLSGLTFGVRRATTVGGLPVILREGGIKPMLLLLILLIVLLFATAPAWPYSRGWGYYPSGGLSLAVLILVLLLLMGRL
jgi:hypothetical protein